MKTKQLLASFILGLGLTSVLLVLFAGADPPPARAAAMMSPAVIASPASPAATRAYTLTGLTNYTWYTVTLNAMLKSAPFLTDTVRVMPTDVFIYLPLVCKELW